MFSRLPGGAGERLLLALALLMPAGCGVSVREWIGVCIDIHDRKVTEDAISKVAERLNNRPRKCLGYQTPAEVFTAALSGALAT